MDESLNGMATPLMDGHVADEWVANYMNVSLMYGHVVHLLEVTVGSAYR